MVALLDKFLLLFMHLPLAACAYLSSLFSVVEQGVDNNAQHPGDLPAAVLRSAAKRHLCKFVSMVAQYWDRFCSIPYFAECRFSAIRKRAGDRGFISSRRRLKTSA